MRTVTKVFADASPREVQTEQSRTQSGSHGAVGFTLTWDTGLFIQQTQSEAERWQRAKEFIDREIEAHQQAIDAGGISFDEFHVRSVKREAYQSILEAVEGGEE